MDELGREISFNIVDEDKGGNLKEVKIKYASHKEYEGQYHDEYTTGNCTLLDITKVGDKYVVRFSEFCKLWFTELADLDQIPDHITSQNVSNEEKGSLSSSYPNNLDNVVLLKMSTPDVEVTYRFFRLLESVPCDLSGQNYQKMITKISAITALSKLPETKHIYDQLSKTIDFGQLLALVTTKEENQ